MTTSWQGADVTTAGAIGLAIACIHASPISLDRPAHADGVDLGRCRQRADRDRHVVAAAFAVDHIGEQKGAPLLFVQAALELPAHQRMQLGVLVDRPLDAHEQAIGFEPRQMLLEIERRPARFRLLAVLELRA